MQAGVEIVLISVTIIIYAIIALLIITGDTEFFTKPLLEITIDEFISIIFVIGWIIVILGDRR